MKGHHSLVSLEENCIEERERERDKLSAKACDE